MIDYLSMPEERMKLLRKDRRWEPKLKKLSDVKVSLSEDVEIEGEDPLEVMRVKLVFQAFGRGFEFEDALNLLDDEFALETINVGDYAKSQDRVIELKGRVIGTKGKSKDIIEKKTETKISIYGKTICMIGRRQDAARARDAIELLLSGRKHGTAYRFLEWNFK